MHASGTWRRAIRVLGLLSGAAIGWTSTAAWAQATLDKVNQRGWINVGYRVGAAPFSNQDAAGQPIGYAIEFCKPIVERLAAASKTGKDTPVKYVAVATDQRLKLVKEGSIDILCDSTTDTPDRRSQVDFSTPIFVDAVQLMVRSKDNIANIGQLAGKSLVAIGTTTAPAVLTDYASKKSISWQVTKAVNAEAAFGQLQLGWAQGFARDGVLLASMRVAQSTPADYVILPERLSSEPIALAFRRGDAAMRKLVDGVITESMQNGNFQAWYDKWFLKAVAPAKQPLGIPMSDELKGLMAKAK